MGYIKQKDLGDKIFQSVAKPVEYLPYLLQQKLQWKYEQTMPEFGQYFFRSCAPCQYVSKYVG